MSVIDRVTRKQRDLAVEEHGDHLLVATAGVHSASRRFMTTNNQHDGAREMAVLGTLGAPVRFRLGPPAGQIWGICSVIVSVSDNAPFAQTDFGAIAGPLTNGLYIGVRSEGVDMDLYSGYRVKQNSHWFGMPARISLTTWVGSAQTLEASFNIYQDTGQYNLLDGDLGQELFLDIQDDLTTLTGMRAVARYIRLK